MSFLGIEVKSFPMFEGSRSETQAHYYCTDRECTYITRRQVFIQRGMVHRPSCEGMKEEVEGEGISWKAGNMSCHERDSLGDKSV